MGGKRNFAHAMQHAYENPPGEAFATRVMTTSTHLLATRRFLPLFVTQMLGAFNDNLFKNALVLFVVYSVLGSEEAEAKFSAIASTLFILPFFLLSALAGQLADLRDKAKIIRIIKLCEIAIMAVGSVGLLLAWQKTMIDTVAIPLMLAAVLAMGTHSTFFGPIKYAILPQHLREGEVLAGTGLVEAGTYVAILAGTILAGTIPVQYAAVAVMVVALAGYITAREVPAAPPVETGSLKLDFHFIRSSITLVRNTMDEVRVFRAIMAISVFWAIGAVLFIQFPPLAKNVLTANKQVASLFLVMFSVGVAVGSASINHLLKGKVSARFAPPAVLLMALFVIVLELLCGHWTTLRGGALYDLPGFIAQPLAVPLLLSLLFVAISGGMFVVPLYAFLTTCVSKCQTARTIAANNIVNSGMMVLGSLAAVGLSAAGVSIVHQLLLTASMCVVAAYLAMRLYRAECEA